jgi:hypothetical protein
MALDAAALRAKAAGFRAKATALHRAAQGVADPKMRDAYTAIIGDYDALALELEQMADEIAS